MIIPPGTKIISPPAPVDISQMSDTEMEALAYREIKQLTIHQNNLAIIEQELERRRKMPVSAKKEDPPGE
jgi:hypothetical protein